MIKQIVLPYRSLFVCGLFASSAWGQIVLKPTRVFDGEALHEGWAVRVRGDRVEAAGPTASIDTGGAKVIDLPGATLLPGLVEGHSHILLHAYNETPWNDQVAHEGLALRVARAVNHLRATLMAGFTTVRDLGTEGAAYADVELKQAVNQGIIPGPRILASTRAIVATGSYAPKGFALEWRVPQGAEEADGIDGLIRVVRDQIGHGADWIKLYGDYRWGPAPGAHPTFSLDEMKLAVETAKSAGVPVAVHASTPEVCAARLWPESRLSSTATAARPRSSNSWSGTTSLCAPLLRLATPPRSMPAGAKGRRPSRRELCANGPVSKRRSRLELPF
jgi:imidazolonepropionase-like amidohydrolase